MMYTHALPLLLLARGSRGFTGRVSTRRSTTTSHGRLTRHSTDVLTREPIHEIASRRRRDRAYQTSHPLPRPFQLHASVIAPDVVDLKYTEYSKPADASSSANSKPPVLIVHGLLGQSRNFASIAQSLAAQLQFQRRIIAVDLRNHGESGHADSMSYTAQAQDLLAVMDREGMEEAVLIGHSMGGKVVKAAALLHPERVAGLVVMDISRESFENLFRWWQYSYCDNVTCVPYGISSPSRLAYSFA
jgi:pimeloyl-ACP methyl ester carboxylesterase